MQSASVVLPCGLDTLGVQPPAVKPYTYKFQKFADLDSSADDIQLLSTANRGTMQRIHPMVFSIGQYPNTQRPFRRLTQKFIVNITDSFTRKNNGYYYKIRNTSNKNHEISISKTLITGNLKEIERQMENLLHECNRFFYLYCEPANIKKPKATMPF